MIFFLRKALKASIGASSLYGFPVPQPNPGLDCIESRRQRNSHMASSDVDGWSDPGFSGCLPTPCTHTIGFDVRWI